MTRHRWVSVGLAAGVLLATAPLVFFVGIGSTLLGRTLQNFGHVPLFALIATLLLVFAAHWFGEKTGIAVQYVGAFAAALFVGVATEFVQMLGNRDADLLDLTRNAVGAALALVWWATFDRRLDVASISRGSRIALRGLVIAVLLFLLAPFLGVANAYRERDNRFPVLYSFETSSQSRFMVTRLTWYELVAAPESWAVDSPERVAHISFSPLAGGALVFNEPYPDWTGHKALILEFFLPGERAIRIGLRIDDHKHPVHLNERFNRHLDLEPGFGRLRIPMEEIVAGPTERELDISSIKRVIVFPIDPVGGYEIYLRRILLETEEIATSSRSPD